MKQVFVALAMVGLVSCQTEEKVHIMGTQHDFTKDDVVETIDSVAVTTVNELLDHLETLPAE